MKTWHWIALGALTVGSLALQLFGPEHPHPHAWDRIPAFYALYGFVGCILIIVISKGLGKAWLQKREDYYDEPDR
jgi:hypothetical protein